MTNNVNVKKIHPYPFEVEILASEGKPPVKGLIHKVTYVGFLMRVQGTHHFLVGQNHQSHFTIPGSKYLIDEAVKVVKTYDALEIGTQPGLHKIYTIEMHFRDLQQSHKEWLSQFFQAIGQK